MWKRNIRFTAVLIGTTLFIINILLTALIRRSDITSNYIMKTKGLVIAAGVGMPFHQLRAFVKSFRRHVPHHSADLVVMVSSKISQKDHDRLLQHDVIVHQDDLKGAVPQLTRLLSQRKYLQEIHRHHNTTYDLIILADTRDVIFQSDPFEPIRNGFLQVKSQRLNTNGLGVLFAMEGGVGQMKLIKDCPYNSEWIKSCFGKAIYEELKYSGISCCGVIAGDTRSIMQYLDLIAELIRPCWGVGGADQSVHNYMLHYLGRRRELPFPAHMMINGNHSSVVATIGYTPRDQWQVDDGVVTINGFTPAIIHQYDRFGELREAVEKLYI
jgi:hypothetical protein